MRDFWCHVDWGTDIGPQRTLATIPRLGEAEIRHLDDGYVSEYLISNEDVLQFEIAVTKLLLVEIVDTVDDLVEISLGC